mgnify:CR=1 FL=1
MRFVESNRVILIFFVFATFLTSGGGGDEGGMGDVVPLSFVWFSVFGG